MNIEMFFTNREIHDFLLLLKNSIHSTNILGEYLLQNNLRKYYHMSSINKLISIVYPSVKFCNKTTIDKNSMKIMEEWLRRTILETMLESKKYNAIENLISESEKVNVKLVFFKGAVLADLYPKYLLRTSSDTDIFVYEKDRDKVIRLLENLGYVKNEEHSKDIVPVYFNKELLHCIELHFCLWEDYEGPKMKLLEDLNLIGEDTIIEISACNMTFFTLGYEEHLIYQIFHIIKHFSLESVALRYLTDITLYINRFGGKIDFSSFWNKIKMLGYETFCFALFEICSSYLGMDDQILKEAGEIEKVDKDKLLTDIFTRDTQGMDNPASWQIFGTIAPYLEGREGISDSKWKQKMKLVFPPINALPDKCSYAKQYKFLLPVAWIHRDISCVIRYLKYYRNRKHVTEVSFYGPNLKLKAAEYRLSLMKKYGLVKNNK